MSTESIEESFKQIGEYKQGKRKFKTLEEAQELWDKWADVGIHDNRMDIRDEEVENTECEWDTIRSIFQSAIKRKGLTKEQVHETSERLLREVREERYCTVAESLEQSLKEMQLMRQGKLPKKTWKEYREEKQSFWDMMKELESEIDE